MRCCRELGGGVAGCFQRLGTEGFFVLVLSNNRDDVERVVVSEP